ncbi:hypothetical protein BDQ94DRAFT_49521 [Aspergillus welwitschiae]|uniref:Uncharacterized protein n=1 Tax=Aspergillus welwitschiae TaxID=1341132 RepID=A0A3F3QJQ4_9EURO|nr:hypothetical protein BDQ94DRAFT_49521 [Aspergillus welwitschiae]RDH38916.1 hypothetical protein BDQ94DRAFT_49521 [Aspergillus welwitschiae]
MPITKKAKRLREVPRILHSFILLLRRTPPNPMAPKLLFLFEKDNDRYWLSDATGLPIADGCPLLDLKDKELVYETELLIMVTSAMEAKLVPANYNYLASYKIAETYYVLLEERIDGGFTAISPSSNSATLGDGDSAKSDDETPTTRRPPTYSLSDGEDNDCTDSDIVNPSQSTTVPSASSHDGILTPSQSTATTRAFSPADVDRSDDPKRDGVKISESDGLSPANKTVPSTEKSYKTPEVATDYGSDTDGEPIDSGRRRRQPIMTEVPPREPPSQPATDFFSEMARTDYTWGGIDASGCIEFVPDQESRSNPIRVGPGPEIPSGSDPQSKTNHFTPSTTRKPLPYPPANNGLPTSRATPYYTKWGWYQPPAYGPTNPFGPQ